VPDIHADIPASTHADTDVDIDVDTGRWLTYDEFAKVRGINRRAAVRFAMRHRLRRQPGNGPDRTVRVWVPASMLTPPPTSTPRHAGIDADIRADIGAVRLLIESKLAQAETRLADAEARAERAEQALAVQELRERQWWTQSRWRRLIAAWRGA
jgi:hypothetical protein